MLTTTEHEVLSSTRAALMAVGRGAKEPIVAAAASTLGCSVNTVYSKLKLAGFTSGRKRRSDAGECMLSEDQLRLVAGVLMASINKKGQRMPVGVAIDILRAGGQLGVDVSESTVSRQLYLRNMHPEQMALPTPSEQLRSKHPNHVWQCDSTTGAYYYMPNGRLRWMAEEDFNKNKVKNLVRASKDLLTRYAITDHTSAAFKNRHYLGGETAANLIDFLVWAMSKQPASPIHGVPFVLMMDPGGANGSHLMANFARRLGIDLRLHMSSKKKDNAARVTGSVEKTHDLVRMHFETRLRFENPAMVTLERLNDQVEAWSSAYCSRRVHTRTGRTRYACWMEIEPAQLRVATPEAMREAAVKEPETRRVTNDRTITFGTPSLVFDLRHVPGARAGLSVTVVQNAYRAPAIDVRFVCPETHQETWHVVEPATHDKFGFRDGANAGPMIGEEIRSAAFSDVDRNRNELTRDAYSLGDGLPTVEEANRARKAHAQAFAGMVDAFADVKATPVPAYLPRRATELQTPERKVEVARMSIMEASALVRRRLGARYMPQMYAEIEKAYPEGSVPEDQIEALCEQLLGASQPPVQTGLRAVGGGAA